MIVYVGGSVGSVSLCVSIWKAVTLLRTVGPQVDEADVARRVVAGGQPVWVGGRLVGLGKGANAAG